MAKKRRKLNFKEFIVISVAVIAFVVALATQNTQPKACTMEAKICPDGSAVGRVPPNCDFAPCPQTNQTTEELCTNSGGTVTKQLCCGSAGDFPNTCLIGACGCAPNYSHEVKACDCGEGKCFDGKTCVSVNDNTSCESDSDCVGATCCHPTSCINKAYKGVCNELCTQICQGPLDCGAGSCGCVNHKCTVISK